MTLRACLCTFLLSIILLYLLLQLIERRSLRQFNKNLEKGHEVYIVSIPKSEHKSNECRQAKEVELNKLKNFEVYKEVEGTASNIN